MNFSLVKLNGCYLHYETDGWIDSCNERYKIQSYRYNKNVNNFKVYACKRAKSKFYVKIKNKAAEIL